MYWGALKQKVYAKNWSAKNRDQLTDQKNQEMDSQIYVRMFENLHLRINLAKENGLDKSFVNA